MLSHLELDAARRRPLARKEEWIKAQGNGERGVQRREGPVAVMDEVDDMMDRMLTGWPWMRRAYHRFPQAFGMRGWAPAIDVFERDNNMVIRADLPGVKREDVDVSIEDNILSVRGRRKEETEVKDEDYYRMEREFGEFSRSVRVPQGTKPEDVQASFKDGVLEVEVPKPEEAQRKQVKVQVK